MREHRETVLVVDDDELFRDQLKAALEELDCLVLAFPDLDSAHKDLAGGFSPSLVFADRQIGGQPIENRLLREIKHASPGSHVVIYTRIDELTNSDVSKLLSMGAIRVLDKSEVADSVAKILREFKELRELSSALDELTRGRSHLVTALLGSDVGVTMVDREYKCWFANDRQQELVQNPCTGGPCWRLFYDRPVQMGPCWGCGIADILDEPFSKKTVVHRTILSHLRDDRVLWLSVETKPIRGSDGRIIAGTEAVSILDDAFVQNMDATDRLFGVARGLVHAGFGRVRIYERQAGTKLLKLVAAAARADAFEAKDYFESLLYISLEYTKCPYTAQAVRNKTGTLVKSWDHGDSPFKVALDLQPPYFVIPMWSTDENHLLGLLAADFIGWDEARKPVAIQHLAREETLKWIRDGYANEARQAMARMQAGTEVVSRELLSRQQAALRARQRIGAASSLDEAIAALRDGFARVAPDCEFCVRCRKGNSLVAEPRLSVPADLPVRDVVAIDDQNSLAAYVLTTHLRPLWIDDYPAYRQGREPFAGPTGLPKKDIRSAARIPLSFESTIYGVLSVDSRNSHRWNKEGFVEPLIDLAQQAALVLRDIAIRDAFEQARLKTEEAERLLAEQQVLELQTIAYVAEFLPLCVFVKDRNHRFLYVNRSFAEDLGMLQKDILGKTDVDLFGEDVAAIYQRAEDWVMSSGNTFEDTDEARPGRSGEPRETQVLKSPFRSPSGEIQGVLGVYWDVTETNRSFRQVQSWRDGFVQSANAIVYAHDMEGTITFVNQAATKSLGYGSEELARTSIYDLILPEDRDAVRVVVQSKLRPVAGSRLEDVREFSVVTKDKRTLNLEVATSICEVQPGKQGILGVAHDVTERNQARAALAHELERIKALRSISSGFGRAGEVSALLRLFMLAVTHGQCLGFSRAILFLPSGDEGHFVARLAVGSANWAVAQERWNEAKRVTFEEAVAVCMKSDGRVRPGDLEFEVGGLEIDLSKEPKIAQELRSGKPVIRRLGQPSPIMSPRFTAAIHSDPEIDVEYVLAPLGARGKPAAILWADRAFVNDPIIPEACVQHFDFLWAEQTLMAEALQNRAREEEVRVAQDIARGMSYSLFTRAGILEADLALLKWSLGRKHTDAIQKMSESIEFFKRAGALATKDLRLTETGLAERVDLDFNIVVTTVVTRRQSTCITTTLSNSPLSVWMNRTDAEDIVLELLANALDFADSTSPHVEVVTTEQAGFARLDISDNGEGIHLAMRPNLFKRFKRHPEGRMGMGLAYVKGLVEAYGGKIWLVPETEKGAHFAVILPLKAH